MFLGAGSVMHGTEDDVNMRHYGALRKAMPVTFATFALGYLAIIGVPPFAGFWSKDKIIESAFEVNTVAGIAAVVGAGVTAFYMTRLMLMTYFGKERWEPEVHPHESPKVMTVPLMVLAALSALGGLLLVGDFIVDWLAAGRRQHPESELAIPSLLLSADRARGRPRRGLRRLVLRRCSRGAAPPRRQEVSFVTRAARAELYGDAFNNEVHRQARGATGSPAWSPSTARSSTAAP